MAFNLKPPISYLITNGATTPDTSPSGEEFLSILSLVRAAVEAGISLVQLREKRLTTRTLFELTLRAAAITRRTQTRLLVNDRADIARGAGADGVHLTTSSLAPAVIRRSFGADLLVGVSTHSLAQARAARDGGASFAVFGPIYETESKRIYGPPVGVEQLRAAAREVAPFPLIALGGIKRAHIGETLNAGASGVAGIGLFSDPATLKATVEAMRGESTGA